MPVAVAMAASWSLLFIVSSRFVIHCLLFRASYSRPVTYLSFIHRQSYSPSSVIYCLLFTVCFHLHLLFSVIVHVSAIHRQLLTFLCISPSVSYFSLIHWLLFTMLFIFLCYLLSLITACYSPPSVIHRPLSLPVIHFHLLFSVLLFTFTGYSHPYDIDLHLLFSSVYYSSLSIIHHLLLAVL